MKANKADWVSKIKDYCLANYDNGYGYQCIIECFDDSMILEEIEDCTSYRQALAEIKSLARLYSEQEEEVSSTSFY